MRFKHIFLDFDGTLVKSGPGLYNALAYMFGKLNMDMPDEKTLRAFIGPPLRYTLKRYGMTDENKARAYAYFREYYENTGIYEMSLYDGIAGLLDELKDKGCALYVATGKRTVHALRAVENLGIGKYFGGVFGAEVERNIITKGEILKNAFESLGGPPEDAVMVGDRGIDIEGGRINGIATIGVLYGYGEESEIRDAGPDHIAGDVAALKSLLTG